MVRTFTVKRRAEAQSLIRAPGFSLAYRFNLTSSTGPE